MITPCPSMLSLKRIRVHRWPCPLWPQDRAATQSTLLVRRGARSAHSKFPSPAESVDSWSSLLSFLLCADKSMHRRPLLRLWRSTVRVSRACEREKGADIVHIGGLQRVDITP